MKKNYLTQKERLEFYLPPQLEEILVGLILGDLCLSRRSKNTLSVRALFKQGLIHKDYLMHLYELFNTFGSQIPKTANLLPDKRTGKIHSAVSFNTYSLPCFFRLYSLFYPEGKKIVPSNIGDLLTPLSLAYWLSDDGSFDKRSGAILLHTQGFTLEQVQLLVKTLNEKFDLRSSINKSRLAFTIRISSKSLANLQKLLTPHMPNMMLYKIGL